MSRQLQSNAPTIMRRRSSEYGTDLYQRIDGAGSCGGRDDKGVDHFSHRASRAGLDELERAPAVHVKLCAAEHVVNLHGDHCGPPEEHKAIGDCVHSLPPSNTQLPPVKCREPGSGTADGAATFDCAPSRMGEWRVALVLPGRGPAGIFGLECRAAAELAAAEIDAAGGVAGRSVQFVHVEAGGEPAAVGREIKRLLDNGAIDAVTGWHLSNARQAIAKVVRGRMPYVYAAAYEGGERSDGVLCSGEVPGDQILASLSWFRTELRLRRWFVVGNDYVWPRGTAAATRLGLRDTDISVVAERFLPLDTTEPAVWDRVLDEIVHSRAEGVITLLVGSDAVRFNRAFARRELESTTTRFSPFTDETVILASGAESTTNLFISAGWFADLRSASAAEFTEGFTRAFDLVNGTGPLGETRAPQPGTMAETTYSGMHFLASIASQTIPTVEDTRRAFEAWGWDSPHGSVDFRAGAARHPVHLARANDVALEVIARVR